MLLMGAGRQRLADFAPIGETGTITLRVNDDAKSFDGGNWNPTEGVIIFDNTKSARFRFSQVDDAEQPPPGAIITGVNLRMTGALVDSAARTLLLRAFNSGGDIAGSQTLETVAAAAPFVDDGTEKTVPISVPTSWSLDSAWTRNSLDIRMAAAGNEQIVCSEDLNGPGLDLYVDIGWST